MKLLARISACAMASLTTCAALAQSPFQDVKGKSSLLFPHGGYASLAFDQSSARFGYLWDQGGRLLFGLDLQGAAKGDRAQLFSDGDLSSDASVTLTFGWRLNKLLGVIDAKYKARRTALFDKLEPLLVKQAEDEVALKDAIETHDAASVKKLRRQIAEQKPAIDQLSQEMDALAKAIAEENRDAYEVLALQVSGRAARYQLVDPDLPFDSQLSKKSFEGWGFNVAYNSLLPGARWGFSIGSERDNNVDDLKAVEVIESTTVIENGVQRTLQTTRRAYEGQLETVDRMPFRVDLIAWPKEFSGRIGINLYSRVDLNAAANTFTPGVGIFLAKEGAPSAVIGGLTVMYDKSEFKLALVAGYKF